MSEWISVEDRLPEVNQWVLAAHDFNGKYQPNGISACRYVGEGDHHGFMLGSHKQPTMWMPIPSLPKE